MTTISVDIISDLHVEDWGPFNWTGQPTSPYCIVVGDVSRDRHKLKTTLAHLGECYQQVFYIDGNDEHRNFYDNLDASYDHLGVIMKGITNVTYLHNYIVILNNVAIVATNGWWTFDFDPNININTSIDWFNEYTNTSYQTALNIIQRGYDNAAYLMDSVKRLQMFNEVDTIVLVTHTVPAPWLVNHDIDLVGDPRFNCLGNQHLSKVFSADTENKIKFWITGHYHNSIDRELAGVNYISNVRGRANTPWCQTAFYPRRLVLSD